MDIHNLLSIKTREELRLWLEKNSESEKCCWVVVSIKKEEGKIQYLDAVEEALCFGWIDGVKKKISDTQTAQRLSPRTAKSSWTELNKERVRRLEKMGLMTELGKKVLPNMELSHFKIDEDILIKLKSDPILYQNFTNFPELYSRIRIDTIQSYKHEPDLFEKRLSKFIENTKTNKLYGSWSDNGRLYPNE